MLGGRAGEIVSWRETPSQCGRVGSPVECHRLFEKSRGSSWSVDSRPMSEYSIHLLYLNIGTMT